MPTELLSLKGSRTQCIRSSSVRMGGSGKGLFIHSVIVQIFNYHAPCPKRCVTASSEGCVRVIARWLFGHWLESLSGADSGEILVGVSWEETWVAWGSGIYFFLATSAASQLVNLSVRFCLFFFCPFSWWIFLCLPLSSGHFSGKLTKAASGANKQMHFRVLFDF